MYSLEISEYKHTGDSTISVSYMDGDRKMLVMYYQCDCIGEEFKAKYGSLVSELEDFVSSVNDKIEELTEEIYDLSN